MAIVAGVDFGTLSVRVSPVDSERGLLASGVQQYPLHRKREDPEYATQSNADHMRALAAPVREAVRSAGVPGDQVAPPHRTFLPDRTTQRTYEALYPLLQQVVFHSGPNGRRRPSRHPSCIQCGRGVRPTGHSKSK
jgi:hypothetical protein